MAKKPKWKGAALSLLGSIPFVGKVKKKAKVVKKAAIRIKNKVNTGKKKVVASLKKAKNKVKKEKKKIKKKKGKVVTTARKLKNNLKKKDLVNKFKNAIKKEVLSAKVIANEKGSIFVNERIKGANLATIRQHVQKEVSGSNSSGLTQYQVEKIEDYIIVQTFEKKYGKEIESHVDITDYISKEEHYYRNEINSMFINHYLEYKSINDIKREWNKATENKDVYHENTSSYNDKYWGPITKYGQPEVIINSKTNKIVDDPRDMGTWNYGIGADPHTLKDVKPYWDYGNTSDDPTPQRKRIFGPKFP